MKKHAILFFPVLLLALASCEKPGSYDSKVMAPPPPPMVAAAPAYDSLAQERTNSAGGAVEGEQAPEKRIARTHNIEIRTDGTDLTKRFEADSQKCASLGCDITNSSISENYATLNIRLEPAKLDGFLKYLSREGAKVASHSISSDDRTVEYIDTDARIKTSEALKVRLTTLLNTTESKDIKAILEIEKELARVQQEIDSAKSTLKYLTTITSFVTLNINYTAEVETGNIEYKDLKNSFRYAWQGFIRNIAHVIEFIGMSLPWIPVIVLGIWILRKTIRFKRRKKEEPK